MPRTSPTIGLSATDTSAFPSRSPWTAEFPKTSWSFMYFTVAATAAAVTGFALYVCP